MTVSSLQSIKTAANRMCELGVMAVQRYAKKSGLDVNEYLPGKLHPVVYARSLRRSNDNNHGHQTSSLRSRTTGPRTASPARRAGRLGKGALQGGGPPVAVHAAATLTFAAPGQAVARHPRAPLLSGPRTSSSLTSETRYRCECSTYLAGADENILLPLGGDAQAIVAASPVAVSLPVRPSGALEARSAAKAEEGDAADLDISAYADDPAFTHLIEDEDPDEKSAADDEFEDE